MARYKLESAFLLTLGLYAYAYLRWDLLAWMALTVVVSVLGGFLAVRWGRVLLRRVIRRLRDRLIVAYIFISVIPISLVVWLAVYEARSLGGQIAAYLVHSELDRRVDTLGRAAGALAQAPEPERAELLERMGAFYKERFPGYQIVVENPGEGTREIRGIVVKSNQLYVWVRSVHRSTCVTMMAPLSQKWLEGLTPGLGQVSIIHFPVAGKPRLTMRLQDAGEQESEAGHLPEPANWFDFEVLWAKQVPVALWDEPQRAEMALLGVHSRLSAVLGVLFRGGDPMPAFLYFWVGVFLLVQVISIYIGVSVSGMITGAVHDLYEGTQRVTAGDFSHRIKVKGDDQIAELSKSFNLMTENIEHLLQVAKEKERIDTEIEIAKNVQAELFPRNVPSFENTDLKGVCHPARMVSGDYYDYQPLGGTRIVLALGDVAGKGVSAALLMASLQACLRMQARQVRDASATGTATGSGEPPHVSPARLVSSINQQLHASTSAEKYATFFLAVYDDASGEFTYTNAGHLQPLLVRNGTVAPLEVNGMVVGAFALAKYTESRVTLEPGDVLIGYTDGISEAENEFGEMFGDQRLKEVVEKASALDTATMIDTIMDAAKKFAGTPELQDDMTVVVLRRR